MDTVIIGVSGKKQSGKNTLCESLKEYFESCSSENTVKIYSFADALKEKICIDVLGLTREQCYGTDEHKNSFTEYLWENFGIGKIGYMTAREIMQQVGTEIFRKYFGDEIWVNATFRQIKKEGYRIALICDVRFPSEVEAVIFSNGYIFRLLRDVCEGDAHTSETALDNYDFSKYKDNAFVIDNTNMSIEEQLDASIQSAGLNLKSPIL
jgi:hypothetical protein